MSPIPILIDTDIGDDIDDALAIGFALRSPELEVKAITTVFGAVETRTQLVRKLLQSYAREDIPVGTGRGTPLLESLPDRVPNQAVVLGELDRFSSTVHENGVALLVDTVMQSDREMILVPIGALTNIAAALLAEPRIKDKARIVLMGGVIGKPMPEWNIRCDPEAARLVFESGARITMVGLDVTLQCKLTDQHVDRIGEKPREDTRLLSAMLSAWMNSSHRPPTLHDPLAIAVAFHPALVRTERKRVRVETRGEFTRAFTVPVSGEPNADVCVEVDARAVVELFMSRIIRESKDCVSTTP